MKTLKEKIQSYIREVRKYQQDIQIAEISEARHHYDSVQDHHRKYDEITQELLRPIFTETLQELLKLEFFTNKFEQFTFLTLIKHEAEQMLEERIQSFQLKDHTHGAMIEPTAQSAETENTFVDGRKIADILITTIKLWKENNESIIEKFQFDLKVTQKYRRVP